MSQAYISLGSDSGNRAENINRAVWIIAAHPKIKVTAVSRLYETKLGDSSSGENPLFGAIRVETSLSPRELLTALIETEDEMGKNRDKNSPTVIDADLLYYEDAVMNTPDLILPHPQIENRPHIICALLSIYADKNLKDRLKDLGEKNVWVVSDGLYMPL